MVHALNQVYDLLEPHGVLINVNDLPTPHMVQVRKPELVQHMGWLMDRENYAPTVAAFDALAKVVAAGSFDLADQQDFDFNIYADSVPELLEWLSMWWQSAVLPPRVLDQAQAAMEDAGASARIVLGLRARMIKLIAV